MKAITKYLLIVGSLLLTFTLNAQQDAQQDTNTCACCTEAHGEFDFWLGEWIVKSPSGVKVGMNTISKREENCLIEEKWVGEAGSTGTSINYYDPNDNLWHQTWISNTGTILKMSGGLVDGEMVLKSDPIDHEKGTYYNQIIWKPNPDGTVTQKWQLFKENGELLQNIFKGIYSNE